MRVPLVWLAAFAAVLFLSAAPAAADCPTSCWQQLNECSSGCSLCNCSQEYEWCMDSCQYIDTDGDGLTDPNDNCPNNSNANQADCDQDGHGNACDPTDNSWYLLTLATSRCYLDEDQSAFGYDLEVYYADIYKSACTNQTCYRKYRKYNLDCGWASDRFQCCLDDWLIPNADCGGAWNVDSCGTPRCNF